MKIKICRICGEEFFPTGRNNVVCQKEECRRKRKKIDRERYVQKKKDEEIRKKFMGSGSINEISRKARESGMSYGKYVLMMQQKVM